MSGSTLKIIAMISMVLDHGWRAVISSGLLKLPSVAQNEALVELLYKIAYVLNLAGRIAFPIFCFLLVEGFLHTGNRKKYAERLLIFAVISEIPFDLFLFGEFFHIEFQNVFFTLFLACTTMIVLSKIQEQDSLWRPLSYLLQVITCVVGMGLGFLLHTDYGYMGIGFILILFYFRCDRTKQILSGLLASMLLWMNTAPLAFLPIYLYNGKRGIKIKYFFYVFYPLHLLILCGVTQLILYFGH